MNDEEKSDDRLIDTNEAAERLGIRPNTLRKARVYGGPNAIRFVKIGRLVKYSVREIAAHVARNTFESTDQAAGY